MAGIIKATEYQSSAAVNKPTSPKDESFVMIRKPNHLPKAKVNSCKATGMEKRVISHVNGRISCGGKSLRTFLMAIKQSPTQSICEADKAIRDPFSPKK